MSEITSTYMPGQKAADNWVLRCAPGATAEAEDLTGIQTSIGGEEQRHSYWPEGGRTHFSFTTAPLTQIQEQEFRDFLRGRRGDGRNFYFFWFEQEYWYRENVGLSDGTANHVIPFQNATTPTEVFDDGGAVTFGFTPSFGTGGEGRLTGITPTPSANSVLTATFYGRRRYIVRCEGAKRTRDFFNRGLTRLPHAQWRLNLVQVL